MHQFPHIKTLYYLIFSGCSFILLDILVLLCPIKRELIAQRRLCSFKIKQQNFKTKTYTQSTLLSQFVLQQCDVAILQRNAATKRAVIGPIENKTRSKTHENEFQSCCQFNQCLTRRMFRLKGIWILAVPKNSSLRQFLGGKKPFHETSQVESHTGKFWATSNLCHSGLNNIGINTEM